MYCERLFAAKQLELSQMTRPVNCPMMVLLPAALLVKL
jgi:hypothetical protein